MVDYGAPYYVYWLLLFPLSIVGIVACVLVVYVWCGKRYKFYRLIIMILAATHALFLILIILFTHMEEGEAKELIKKVTFSVRLYAVTLYVFLAATQYVTTRVLHESSSLPVMASQKRIIGGLLLIACWCALERVLKIMVCIRVEDNEHQTRIVSNAFHVLTLVLPQFLQLVLVCGMVRGIRRYRRWLASGKLRSVMVKSHILGVAIKTGSSIAMVHSSVQKSLARGYSSTSRSHRINPEESRDVGQMLPVEMYQQRADYIQRELLVSKAVTILCIPPIFIYFVGFPIGIYIRLHKRVLRDTFFWVIDVLQFINCGCTFVVLAAMLPDFRRALRRRLLRLCRTDMSDVSEGSVDSALAARSCPQRSSRSSLNNLGEEEEEEEEEKSPHTSGQRGRGDPRADSRTKRSGDN